MIVAFLILCPAVVKAQLPPSPADAASILRHGEVRAGFTTIWQRYDEVFGFTPTSESQSQPLGRIFTSASLGSALLPRLAALESDIASIAAFPGFALNLGAIGVDADVHHTVTPLTVELGLLNRFQVGVSIPLVRVNAEIVLDMNPLRSEGNVGWNPAIDGTIARAANVAIRDQFTAASTALQNALAACTLNPGGAGCAVILAREAEAQALIVDTRALRDLVERVYGSDTVASAPFVPLVGGATDESIDTRIAALNTLYRELLSLGSSAADPLGARPFGAQTALTAAQFRQFLEDPAFGIGMVPLQGYRRQGLGDVELSARMLLFDTFSDSADMGTGIRASVSVVGRLGTGKPPIANVPFDPGTGDGQNDFEFGAATDIRFSRAVSLSAFGRLGIQMADTRELRVVSPGTAFTDAFTLQTVDRDLGDYIDIALQPRLHLGRFATLSGAYYFYSKTVDNYTGVFQLTDAQTGRGPVTLDADILDAGTAVIIQRAGFGLRVANFGVGSMNSVSLPLEFSFQYMTLLGGSGYGVPNSSLQMLQLRAYPRIFSAR